MTATAWTSHDAGFRDELLRGRKTELAVALDLLDLGHSVQTGRCEFREHFEDRHAFADEVDLIVDHTHRLEIKSRNLEFTGTDDYPYDTAFVCATRRWDARTHKPCAVVLVSEKTGSRVVVPTSTRRSWVAAKFYDSKRGFTEQAYATPKPLLHSWDALLEHFTFPCGRFGEL